MHRQKTQFARRVNRVLPDRVDPYAKALENRGIRATYELHDRVLSNRRVARASTDERPSSTTSSADRRGRRARGLLARCVLRSLPGAGATGTSSRRCATGSSPRRRPTSRRAASTFASARARSSSCASTATASRSASTTRGSRACASRRMLDVANTYLRMWSKLEYVDVWYSVPQPEDASRVSSQLWHRDYNDKHLLKAFLYLVDVDETMGPFQYIPGSQPGGPYADAWPWKPLGKNYPTEGELEQRIPARRSRPSSARRRRSSSATRPASIAAGSRRPPARACAPRPTRRPRRSRR